MAATDLFDLYHQLDDTVSRQKNAALEGDWEALPALEIDCGRIIEALKRTEPLTDLPSAEREKLMFILSKIAENQQEVRKLAEEGRSQLGAQIKSIRTEQRIMQAYGLA